jgi:hypothetical protein
VVTKSANNAGVALVLNAIAGAEFGLIVTAIAFAGEDGSIPSEATRLLGAGIGAILGLVSGVGMLLILKSGPEKHGLVLQSLFLLVVGLGSVAGWYIGCLSTEYWWKSAEFGRTGSGIGTAVGAALGLGLVAMFLLARRKGQRILNSE